MFDFDAGKFLIIGIVALVVIGPKELPRVLRQVGQAVARVRRMASEFQGQFMDAMKEADLETIRQDLKKIGDDAHAELNTHFDPARDIQRELQASLDTPAVAAEVPALAAAPVFVTDGFALPHSAEALDEGADATHTVASAGLAPVAEDTAVPVELVDNVPDGSQSAGRKRRIVIAKRPATLLRPHAVTDRTERARPLGPRPRGQEIVGR